MRRTWLMVGLVLAVLLTYRLMTFPVFDWHSPACLCDECLGIHAPDCFCDTCCELRNRR